jgi:hypothetical protein
VKFFFANDFVGYIESPQFRRMPEALVGAKGKVREVLQMYAVAGKITWTSLTGGPFFDMWLMKGPAGFDIANRRARIYGTGENPLFWTPLPVIAQAAANMLKNPTGVANRPIHICPFAKGELTQHKLLSALQNALDGFSIEEVDLEEINRNARIALSRGEAGKALKGLIVSNQFYEKDSGNDFSHLIENELVGVDKMTVEDAVRDAIAMYGPNCPVKSQAMFMVEACEI